MVLPLICGFAIWLFVALPLINLPVERLGELPHKAPLVTALAASFAAATAIAAFFVARRQLNLNRENQKETTGKTIFRDFLKLCVEHPDFAYGRFTNEQRAAYEWFVAHFLWAAEEILEYAPTEWEPNLRLHISYHRDFLQNDPRFRTEDWPTYTKTLRDFVEKALTSLAPTAPHAYVIAADTISDANQYGEYRDKVIATLDRFRGQLRGGNLSPLEGDWSDRQVSIVEFPSRQDAEEWYKSSEYQTIIPFRRASAAGGLAIVDGL
jgi:uncharacterized protein (DUF1330 family)